MTEQERRKEQRKQAALAYLRSVLKPGSIVYTVTTHVSRSGMRRNTQVLCVETATGTIQEISAPTAAAAGFRFDGKRGGVSAYEDGGAIVTALSQALFDGNCGALIHRSL